MAPRISVILPAYNAASTLTRAIDSIRTQTWTDWELLVIDDGSTDDTATVLANAVAHDPRIRALARPHSGIVNALNAGLAVARGEFIARMDADDESHPDRFADQVALLEQSPDLGLASCLVEFGGNRNLHAGYALHVDWINSLVNVGEILLNRFVESPLAHPSVMFRKELLEKHGGYCVGDFPEDYELWLRWLDAGVRMEKCPRVLLRWTDPPSRLSRTDPRYSPDAFFRLKAAWIARAVHRAAAGRRLWVWGAGRPTRKRAAALENHGVEIAGYIDIDAKKTTPALGGRGAPVVHASSLPAREDAFILGYVSSRGARYLIRTALVAAGFREGADFLMCA